MAIHGPLEPSPPCNCNGEIDTQETLTRIWNGQLQLHEENGKIVAELSRLSVKVGVLSGNLQTLDDKLDKVIEREEITGPWVIAKQRSEKARKKLVRNIVVACLLGFAGAIGAFAAGAAWKDCTGKTPVEAPAH